MKRKIAKLIVCTSLLSLVATGCGAKTTIAEDTMNTADVTETVSTETTEPVAETIAEEPTESVSDNNAALESETEPTTVETEQIESETKEATAEPTAQTAPEPAYTYTDAESVMYAKSSVNVRDLPSVDGTKLGGLNQNQEVNITGTCNETGWYRIAYKDAIGYVSNKYLVTEKIAATQAPAPANTTASNSVPQPAPTQPQGTQSSIRDGFDLATPEGLTGWLQAGHSSSEIINEDPNLTARKPAIENIVDRPRAEAVFALINQERVANGVAELIWSEELYEIAVQRCYEHDSHASVRPGTGENYAGALFPDATSDEIHSGFQNSPCHRDNYMGYLYSYTYGAVAFMKRTSDIAVCYEVFQ